jgi:hypothetical protein
MRLRFLLLCLALSSARLLIAEPPAAPAPEMDALKAFMGTWICEGNSGDPGAPMTTRSVMTIARDLDGFWFSGREVGQKTARDPKPVTRQFYWTFDPVMKEFVGGWLDSRGGWLTHTSRGWEADKLVFVGHIATGPARRSARETFTTPNAVGFMRTFESLENLQWVVISQETCRHGKAASH